MKYKILNGIVSIFKRGGFGPEGGGTNVVFSPVEGGVGGREAPPIYPPLPLTHGISLMKTILQTYNPNLENIWSSSKCVTLPRNYSNLNLQSG